MLTATPPGTLTGLPRLSAWQGAFVTRPLNSRIGLVLLQWKAPPFRAGISYVPMVA